MSPQVKWTLDPKQQEFWDLTEPYQAFFGGVNNGKTFATGLKGLNQCLQYQGGSGCIIRSTYPELIDTSRRVFFELFGESEPGVPYDENSIRGHPYVRHWDKTRNILTLTTGSKVRFRHADGESAIRAILGSQYDWVVVGQAEEVSWEVFETLSHRIGRVKGNPRPQWIALEGNPAGHDQIWEHFKRNADAQGRTGNYYRLIESATGDSPRVSPEYLARLKESMAPLAYKRFVLGSWDAFYGRVYEEYSEATHVIPTFRMPPEWIIGAGMDFGFVNPTVCMWLGQDKYGIFHFYNEHYEAGRDPDYHAGQMRMHGIEVNGYQIPIYCDPSGANKFQDGREGMIQLYADQGIGLIPGNNDVKAGIALMTQLLKIDPNKVNPYTGKLGCPRLLIHANCTAFREEIGLYRWKTIKPGQEGKAADPDEPVKVKDHAMDAARYCVMSALRHSTAPKKRESAADRIAREASTWVNKTTLDMKTPAKDWRFN